MLGQLARLQALNVFDPVNARLRLVAPFPRIDKGLGLSAVFASLIVVNLEIVALGIKWRVNVAKINALTGNFAFKNIEIIAIIKLIFLRFQVYLCCAVLCCAVFAMVGLTKFFARGRSLTQIKSGRENKRRIFADF